MYMLSPVAKVMWVDERSKFLKQQMLEEIFPSKKRGSWALTIDPKDMNCGGVGEWSSKESIGSEVKKGLLAEQK